MLFCWWGFLFVWMYQFSTLHTSAFGLQDSYSNSGHHVFTQQCPKVTGEEEDMFFLWLPFSNKNCFHASHSWLTLMFYWPDLQIVPNPKSITAKGNGMTLPGFILTYLPEAVEGPAPLKHTAPWFLIRIERRCLQGRQPTKCLPHKGKY